MILSGALSYYAICAAYKQITTGETREKQTIIRDSGESLESLTGRENSEADLSRTRHLSDAGITG